MERAVWGQTAPLAGILCAIVLLLSAQDAQGATAEVKPLGGAPALWIDGKPSHGLAYFVEGSRQANPSIAHGQMLLKNFPGHYGGRSVRTRRSFGSAFSVEVDVCVQKVTGSGANFSLIANQSGDGAYYLLLHQDKTGNVAHLWKAHPGAWTFDKWATLPLGWKEGDTVRLKLAVQSGRVAGYANGRLIGQRVDEKPLPPAPLSMSVYHCVSAVSRLGVGNPEGGLLLEDDFSRLRADHWYGVHDATIPSFEQVGLRILKVDLRFTSFWTKPGTYDFGELDRQIQAALNEYPQSCAFGRLHMNPPKWWLAAHPDDICRDHSQQKLWYASFPSQAWLRDASDALRALLKHIYASPYGQRLMGYTMLYAWGPEWFHPSGSTFHDYSSVTRKAFQAWLTAKYKTDAALAAAWHQPAAALAAAAVPPADVRTAGDYYEFFDPARRGNYLADYLRFNSESVVDAIARFAGIIKREGGQRQLVCVYYGYHFPEYGDINYNQRGHHAIDRLAACPDVDSFASPYGYRARQAGGSTLPQTTVGSLRAHGKLWWLEDDTRTHLSDDSASYGRARNVWETVNILKRNGAYALSEGQPMWYLDWANGWYQDRQVMKALQRVNDIFQQSLAKDRRRNAEIAVIVHQRSAFSLRASAALVMPALCHQEIEHLPRIGAPWDTYLLEDLDRIPDYKLYIFLDAFALSEAEKALVRQKVRRGGATALWIYAPGYVAESGLSDQSMSETTGITLASMDVGGRLQATLCDLEDPITRGCPPGLEWSTQQPIGPIVTCRDPAAKVLAMLHAVPGVNAQGRFKTGDEFEPALAVKKADDGTSIWCGVPDLPAVLLRGIAKSAGVHIYDEADDYVCVNRVMLAVHTRYAGKRTIRLPRPCKVTDAFSGETVARQASEFRVDLKQYETRIWWLD